MLRWLWFDVGIKRYTTDELLEYINEGCGLMQESKDIQHKTDIYSFAKGCGLMQESKDIQQILCQLIGIEGCGLMQESKDIQQDNEQ